MNHTTALFFPHTRIGESRLKRVLGFCNQIILYRLPVSQGVSGSKGSEDSDGLVWRDFDFFETREELKSILAEFRHLADTHRDRESLAAFRAILQDTDIERAGSKLMGAVRGTSRQEDPQVVANRSAQVLLHFLEDMDARQAELNGLMAQVMEKEHGLGEVMGVEHDDDDLPPEMAGLGSTEPSSGNDDPFMPRRMAAWARVYKTVGPHDSPLLTDSVLALSALDTGLAKLLGGPGPINSRATEALEPVFRITSNGFAPEAFDSFTAKLMSTTWNRKDLDGLRSEGEGLFGPLDRESAGSALTAYLLPGRDRVESFLAGAGASSVRPDSDYLTGLIFFVG